ncbi:MAG: class I tRNA ligase family protein, partial [Nitrospinota bacterium]|nr:class I tRNA ligase family protein [Nitrospinota bacterium]
ILHLLYSRFFHLVFNDLGLINPPEPFARLLTQGMVIKDGAKMSKSKGNVVDPDEIIKNYGADTARLFILFAAPPAKDLEWSDQGVEGCSRFLKRVWRIFGDFAEDMKSAPRELPKANASLGKELRELRRMTHITIRRLTDDIQNRIQFNTAIAAIMEQINHLYSFRDWWKSRDNPDDLSKSVVLEAIQTLILTLGPFAPHIAEEMWSELGHSRTVDQTPWPTLESSLTQADEILIVVQVNGKVRQKITVNAAASQEDVRKFSLEDSKIQEWVQGKEIKKIIIVPKKLVNIVVK